MSLEEFKKGAVLYKAKTFGTTQKGLPTKTYKFLQNLRKFT